MHYSTAKHGLTRLAVGCLLVVCTSMVFSLGCRRRGRAGGGASSSGGEAFVGTLTFLNQTDEACCGIEVYQDDHATAYTDRVEPGDSADLELESGAEFLFVTSCDGNGFLYADEITISGDTYEFAETSPQSFQERFDYLRRLNRMNTNPVFEDSAARAQMHEAVVLRARDQNWVDEPSVTLIASDAWSVNRHNLSGVITRRRIGGLVGHRFPDGHCGIQIHSFDQAHDGSDFSGPIRYEAASGNIMAGCTMVDWMARQAGGGGSAASSGSSGGGCTNTCSSADDGDCDDGGPGSEYSVCALGTDCGDCGAR